MNGYGIRYLWPRMPLMHSCIKSRWVAECVLHLGGVLKITPRELSNTCSRTYSSLIMKVSMQQRNQTIPSLIFIDGGDPQETREAKKLLGYIDGQTTNPTLVSKNPDVKKYIESGKKFTKDDLLKEYKRIVHIIPRMWKIFRLSM